MIKACESLSVSERRACRVLEQIRSTQRHVPHLSSEDTTWKGKVTVNEGVTLTIRNCTLTVEEGDIDNQGFLLVQDGSLVRISESFKRIRNHGRLELRNGETDFIVYLYERSSLLAKDSKLSLIFFRGIGVEVEIESCEITRITPSYDAKVKIAGNTKIAVFDVALRILENATVVYRNNAFTEDSQGYLMPEVSISRDTGIEPLGYTMSVGQSARVTIEKSQLLALSVYTDSEVTFIDSDVPFEPFGEMQNYGGKFTATNSSFGWVSTNREEAQSTLENCVVKYYVENREGTLHLINTEVAGTLYQDRELDKGEKIP